MRILTCERPAVNKFDSERSKEIRSHDNCLRNQLLARVAHSPRRRDAIAHTFSTERRVTHRTRLLDTRDCLDPVEPCDALDEVDGVDGIDELAGVAGVED